MKLSNLKTIFIYSPILEKKDGESLKKWQFKSKKKLNSQQNISELDRNSAGLIDYEKLQIIVDYEVGIEKGDGISFKELELEDNFTKEAPQYKVIGAPKNGKTSTYICEIYHGE